MFWPLWLKVFIENLQIIIDPFKWEAEAKEI